MAITVASDIVLDVVKAANPMRVKHAAAKLGATQQATASFAQELGKAGRAQGIAPQLPSDIVMDVIAAADPGQSVEASNKLAGLSQGLLPGPTSPVGGLAGLREKLSASTTQIEPASFTTDSRKVVAHRDFEATVLRSFFETMLPKPEGGFYGQGTAGNVWRSMNADYLAQEFAKTGGIGIAQQLDKGKGSSSASAATIAPAPQWPYFSQPSIASVDL
jgi:hypothetical protein